jgi:hypothetical protein
MRLRVFLDAAAFNCCILRCLLQAGIQATSGSSGLVAASAALARDAPLGAVLRLGDRGSAPALSRFCHALCGLVGSSLSLGCSPLHCLTLPYLMGSARTPVGEGIR